VATRSLKIGSKLHLDKRNKKNFFHGRSSFYLTVGDGGFFTSAWKVAEFGFKSVFLL